MSPSSYMEFRKYNTIELINEKRVAVTEEDGNDKDWVVTEKAHGANLVFLYDGSDITVGRRRGLLCEGDSFYSYLDVKERYKEGFEILYKLVGSVPFYLYGELIGGSPIEMFDNSNSSLAQGKQVQRGVTYCPHNDFYAFDIFLPSTRAYIDHPEVVRMCQRALFPVATILSRGTLRECWEWSKAHLNDPSVIPSQLGAVPKEASRREGHVIKPVQSLFDHRGARIIFKHKASDFAEVASKAPVAVLSDEQESLLSELLAYVTQNRFDAVRSKEVKPLNKKNFGFYMRLFTRDVFEDWEKDHEPLEKEERKAINKKFQAAVRSLVSENLE